MKKETAHFPVCDDLRARLTDNIAAFERIRVNDVALRQAAVAIVVTADLESANQASILLTRRPTRLKQHSGQYALPGGKLDSNETVEQAALRELHEELGLELDTGAVIGCLDDYPTRSSFRITPVVMWGGTNCKVVPEPAEVARVFRIPFSELVSDAIPVFEPGVEEDRPVLCSEFPTLGHRMYSPTASMIYQFREVGILGRSTRVAHYDQPRFAWQ